MGITGWKKRWRPRLIWILTGLMVVLCCSPALAADKYWNTSTNWWSNPANWNPTVLPTTGDNVYLTQSSTTK